MARNGISNLRQPKKRFDPRGKGKFDKIANKAVEDRERAGRQRTTAKKFEVIDPGYADTLRRVVNTIDPDITPEPTTMASARRMRRFRRNLTGEFWRLYEERGRKARTFTLMPTDLLLEPDQLYGSDPRQMLAQLRHALLRAGSATASGFLVIGLHGEYDEGTGNYRVHFHGVGEGRMLDVVRRLRRQQRF